MNSNLCDNGVDNNIYSKAIDFVSAYKTQKRKLLNNIISEPYIFKSKIYDNMGNGIKTIKRVKIKDGISCQEEMYIKGELLKMKCKHSIPKVTIVYIILSSVLSGVFLTFILFSLIKGIHIISPITSFLFFLGSVGLLITSISSIKDWRKVLNEI